MWAIALIFSRAGAETYMSYDLPWANASNSPFRLYKHWVHEGGISTPFIVYWPDVIRESSITHMPCHIIGHHGDLRGSRRRSLPDRIWRSCHHTLRGGKPMAGNEWRAMASGTTVILGTRG